MDEKIKELLPIFESFPQIKLVYLFGSKARRQEGPMSDYDFAVSMAGEKKEKMASLKLELLAALYRALKTDAVDVVIFELAQSPELKYNIIREGELIFKREPFKVLLEPIILNEYFDFHDILRRHHLTKT